MKKKVLSALVLAAVVLTTGCSSSTNESSLESDSATTSVAESQNESTLSSDSGEKETTSEEKSVIEESSVVEETTSASESVITAAPTEEAQVVEQESQSQLDPDTQSAEDLIAIVDELYNGINKKTIGEVTDEIALSEYRECNVVKFNGDDSFDNFKNYYCSIFSEFDEKSLGDYYNCDGKLGVDLSGYTRSDSPKYNVVYSYQYINNSDGSMTAVKNETKLGFLEEATIYKLVNTDSGWKVENVDTYDKQRLRVSPIEGYEQPTVDCTDNTSPIHPEGLSAEELADIFDSAYHLFLHGKVGECDGLEGVCVYNGSDSFEWVETLFKQYFTDEIFDEIYDEETGNFLSYVNVDGVCNKRVLGFGGPQPDVIGYEIVTNNDTEIVLRTLYSDSFTDTEYSTISSMVNTENGWRINRYGVDE